MISLFHIPDHQIDTAWFSHLLHDPIVTEFENRFAEYVGAKYAVSVHSATTAIFLCLIGEEETVTIPSILPPVVANAIETSLSSIRFEDNTDWVGGSYVLHEWVNSRLIDSAHRVTRNQFANECGDKDLMIFSFYPTKPVSGKDGGMIVSNDRDAIEQIRIAANNGMHSVEGVSSWEKKHVSVGFKLYMDSIAAWIANENFKNLDRKKERLAYVRERYNKAFGTAGISDHLFRIPVKDNKIFVHEARLAGIECGIHYHALHHNPIFGSQHQQLPKSDEAARTMVSIPFHETLTKHEINYIINFVNAQRDN